MSGLVIDLFAGGGGASVGIEAALGRPVDIAINHSATALAVHQSNHPETRHLTADVWEVKPREATDGRPVALLWASPDCTHFSLAKGDVPREQNIRSLAWVVVRWAREVRPAVILLENVAEFRGWGPLDENRKPIKAQMGETFEAWKRALEKLGYVVDHRILDASLYGTPTKRRRLFLVARRDGLPITWPTPTHGPGRLPVRTAAECIDWSIPCPSIFERPKPLAEKTLWRIAQGIRRFVLENPRPFIVKVNHGKREARGESIGEPLSTVTATQRGHALVAPSVMKYRHDSTGAPADQPLPTVTAGGRERPTRPATGNPLGLLAPTLIQTGYGEREGQRPRSLDLFDSLGTVVAGGQKHALVGAFLAKHFGGVVGQEVTAPTSTITATDHHGLAAVALAKFRGTDPSQPGSGSVEEPVPTISAGGIHTAEVRAFLSVYYGQDGTGGSDLFDPTRTITGKHRLGLVTVEGAEYQIVDIGMRMLEPHELLRAQFGRFAESYDISAAKTKSAKVRLIGNSVCPEVAEALVRANVGELAREVAA